MAAPLTDNRDAGVVGFWPWFYQRISGVLLIFLLAVHIWMGHFSGLRAVIDGRQEELVLYSIVQQRLTQGVFIFVDFSLLGLVLYHGLNGMRNIFLEWPPVANRTKAMTLGLWVLGVVTFAYGAWALLAFIL